MEGIVAPIAPRKCVHFAEDGGFRGIPVTETRKEFRGDRYQCGQTD